jgi:hypothetical protein
MADIKPFPPAPSRPSANPSREYTDTRALEDIQALLNSGGHPREDPLLNDVAAIVERTGRPIGILPRVMSTDCGYEPNGLSFAIIQAEATCVRASQDRVTNGVNLDIRTTSETDKAALTVSVNGELLYPCTQPTIGGKS